MTYVHVVPAVGDAGGRAVNCVEGNGVTRGPAAGIVEPFRSLTNVEASHVLKQVMDGVAGEIRVFLVLLIFTRGCRITRLIHR